VWRSFDDPTKEKYERLLMDAEKKIGIRSDQAVER
jgi:hypothetical protein